MTPPPAPALDPTRALAEFARADHGAKFPARAREMARDALIDCVGCMLIGSREPLAASLLQVVTPAPPGTPGSLLAGTARTAPPADAALYNGTVAHAIDYDDTNHPAYAHPSAVLVPVLLALGPAAGARGRDLVTAYIVGLEVFGKLGRALNFTHYRQGWHATATFGSLAAAAVAGRLLGLGARELARALGIAASTAGGLRAHFGTMTKPLHAGCAARNGVLAALLARTGFTAHEQVLTHPEGYAQVLNHGEGIDVAALASWGEPLEILTDYGLALKPYPSGGATHPGIEAALRVREALGGRTDHLRAVRVGVAERAFDELAYEVPADPLEAKFSLHYCVAAALVQGQVDLATFTPEAVASPAIAAVLAKVRMEVDPAVRDSTEFATIVTAETEAGETFTHTVPLAEGKPARWFTPERLRAKFFDCAGRAAPPGALEPLYDTLRDVERVSAAELADALRAPFA